MRSEAQIEVPQGTTVLVEDRTVKAKGPKGSAEKRFSDKSIRISVEGGKISIAGKDGKKGKRMVNTIQAHIQNLVNGTQKEFEYRLAIVYSHFPMTVAKKEGFIEINNFLGSKQPKKAKILPNVSVEIKGKEITVKGSSRESVGQTAANIESLTKPKGKDRRIFQDGIYIVSKGER